MSAPAAPLSLTIAYEPDSYCCVIKIVAGDGTQDGFKLYEYNNDTKTWMLDYEFESQDSQYETYAGDATWPGHHFKVTAYNADGASSPIETIATEPPKTAAPTNVNANRRGTPNTFPDAKWIDLTWAGILVPGDSWTVLAPNIDGYPQPNIDPITTNNNYISLEIGQWRDHTVEIYPTNNPTNTVRITIQARPPIRSAPSNVIAWKEAYIDTNGVLDDGMENIFVEFECAWLQHSQECVYSDNCLQMELLCYGVTSELGSSIDTGTPGSKVAGTNPQRYVIVQPFWTSDHVNYASVMIGGNSGGFTQEVWETMPDAVPVRANREIAIGTGTGGGGNTPNQITIQAKSLISLIAKATLTATTIAVPVLSTIPIQVQSALRLRVTGILRALKPIKSKLAVNLTAKQGTAKTPSGLGMQMKIIADPFRPDVILDQVLLVWFNGNPNYCKVALKIDDGAELLTAFTWQNPGIINPAILKIDSAAIAGDGQNHRITISVWQAVGNRTSASATISDYAKTPLIRPATQPEWCGATPLRQGETLSNEGGAVCGHIGDLTRVEWRHQGAVQIMAKIPTIAERRVGSVIEGYWKEGSVITIAYCDHDETSFTVEDIGISMGWMNGLLHDVLFGVASIHNGQFGPVTWANAPVKIREILNKPTGQPLTPDQAAGTARLLQLDLLKEEIGQELFTEKGWIYPDYLATGTVNTQRRDVVKSAIDKALFRIKEATRRGGSVTLDNLGRFEARWNPDRTVRSVSFVASPGFIKGTKNGIILTDSQTKQE